eukprot:jgi/Psemu1/10974/gm1.10974_g
MTPSTSACKRGANPHSNGKTPARKKGCNSSQPQSNDQAITTQEEFEKNSPRADSNSTSPGLKDPPIYPRSILSTVQDDDDQQKHWMSMERNLESAMVHQLYASSEFVRALSFEARFQEEDIYSISIKEEGKEKEEKNQHYDYGMNNKWVKFESLLQNVHGETGGGHTTPRLYGRNVVNYTTIKKYLIMYREILGWYMENVQYPPAPENMGQGLLCFYTKCQNGSPHNSQHYVTVMKKFLDSLIAKSSLHRTVPVGFCQQGGNMPITGQVLLPLHFPSVFHYALNYKDTVSNYYNIHFDFDNDNITLSPCKLGNGKIGLIQTQFAHINFEEEPEPLVNGDKALLGLEADEHNHQTSVTQFVQYDVNSQCDEQEVHQRIFMEHIPYRYS